MGSPIKESVQEAKDELDRRKGENGVTVNMPDRGLPNPESPREDKSSDPLEELENELEESPGEPEKSDIMDESHESLFSRVKSSLGLGDETNEHESIEKNSSAGKELHHTQIDLDSKLHTETFEEPVEDHENEGIENDTEAPVEDEPALPEKPETVDQEAEDLGDKLDEIEDMEEDTSAQGLETEKANSIEGEIVDQKMEVPGRSTATETPVSEDEDEVLDNLSEKEALQRQLKDLEEKIVEEESEELGKIAELEKRLEKLELEDREAEERLERVEEEVRTITPPKELDDRMTELENVIMEPENHLDNLVSESMQQRLDSLENRVEDQDSRLEAEVERLGEKQQELQDSVDELKDLVTQVKENEGDIDEVDHKVERLWEAFDQELADIEDRIHNNESDVDEVMSQLVSLSELVKQAMHQ